MDESPYRAWWSLHLRAAKGETLSAEKQAVYDEGKRRLHEEEALENSLIRLRKTREEIKALAAERDSLQECRAQLRQRVKVLEAALSGQAKQALDVGD